MFRKIVNWLVVLPLAIVFVVFAVANRELVTLSFDPFNSADPAIAISLPLFAVIIGATILGVIAGSTATWFGQRRWRRAARRQEAETRAARSELASLQGTALAPPMQDRNSVAARSTSPGTYRVPVALAIGRDKPGATL